MWLQSKSICQASFELARIQSWGLHHCFASDFDAKLEPDRAVWIYSQHIILGLNKFFLEFNLRIPILKHLNRGYSRIFMYSSFWCSKLCWKWIIKNCHLSLLGESGSWILEFSMFKIFTNFSTYSFSCVLPSTRSGIAIYSIQQAIHKRSGKWSHKQPTTTP